MDACNRETIAPQPRLCLPQFSPQRVVIIAEPVHTHCVCAQATIRKARDIAVRASVPKKKNAVAMATARRLLWQRRSRVFVNGRRTASFNSFAVKINKGNVYSWYKYIYYLCMCPPFGQFHRCVFHLQPVRGDNHGQRKRAFHDLG